MQTTYQEHSWGTLKTPLLWSHHWDKSSCWNTSGIGSNLPTVKLNPPPNSHACHDVFDLKAVILGEEIQEVFAVVVCQVLHVVIPFYLKGKRLLYQITHNWSFKTSHHGICSHLFHPVTQSLIIHGVLQFPLHELEAAVSSCKASQLVQRNCSSGWLIAYIIRIILNNTNMNPWIVYSIF